ncbi:hypothetical protein BS50DRAFT_592047 [Corynespora cassiicola Philippines]|uniref:Uncharacterized protein n=1 Tax=Corynespora cassiicola Philippines TaxID=1448308 RepID=A0A2T2NBJ2_CORCC|nr:hypothetical protein BS50DRAFT_592047 [Corynespora cassiicola Philippines]
MTDPLSVAGSVAGLIALGGSTSKMFYQFFRSIHDAPANARELASGLFSLNIVLGQVQEVLLNPDFVQQSEDREAEALGECLTRCTTLLTAIEKKVTRSGLTENQQKIIKKAWSSVRWSFSEDEMSEYRQQAEEEKASLAIVLNAFTAEYRRMTMGLLGEVRQLTALAEEQGEMIRKQHRMIQDVHVILQFRGEMALQDRPDQTKRLEYSAFTASEAYSGNSLANLLGSSNSMLNLRIGDLQDDSVSAVWEPDPATRMPIRRVHSRLSFERPDMQNFEQLRNSFGMKSSPHKPRSSSTALSRLEDVSKISQILETTRKQTSNTGMSKLYRKYMSALEVLSSAAPSSDMISVFGSSLRLIVQASQTANEFDGFMEDLRDIADLIPMMESAVQDLEDPKIQESLSEVYHKIVEYFEFTGSYFRKSSSSRIANNISGTATIKRRELKEKIDASCNQFHRRCDIASRSQLLRQQRETLEEQRRATELQRRLVMQQQQAFESQKRQEPSLNEERVEESEATSEPEDGNEEGIISTGT